eukprot:m.75394 g.75394  ORF g.75394 m.75394 type:complete len:635 (-) comp14479_c0_seq2:212-2116(-)
MSTLRAISALDEAVKEYLLFRGFTQTLRSLEADIKADKDRGFQVDKIVGHLFSCAQGLDLEGLLSFWRHLDNRFFSRLDHAFLHSVRKLELCLLRYYVVCTIQANRSEKLREFFESLAHELQGNAEWQPWFMLPFIKNPESHATFEIYFQRRWLDTFNFSLHNFLSTVFQSIPLPVLLSFDVEQSRLRAMQGEIDLLRSAAEAIGPGATSTMTTPLSAPHTPLAPGRMGELGRLASSADATPAANDDPPTPLGNTVAQELAGQGKTTTLPQQQYLSRQGSKRSSTGPDTPGRETFIVLSQEEFTGHGSGVQCCRLSSRANLVASCDGDSCIKVWTFNPSIAVRATFVCDPSDKITSLCWEQQADRLLFLGLASGKVVRFDVSTSTASDIALSDACESVLALACSPDGAVLVAGTGVSEDPDRPHAGMLLVVCLKTNTVLGEVPMEPHPVRTNSLQFNHNGTLLLTGCADGWIRVIDVASRAVIMDWQGHEGEVVETKFSRDETTVLTAGVDGKLFRWNAHQLSQPMEENDCSIVVPQYAHAMPLSCGFAIDGDDEFVLRSLLPDTPQEPGNAAVFQLQSSAKDGAPSLTYSGQVLALDPHGGAVVSVDWDPVTCTCFTASLDGTVRVTKLFRVT